MVVDASFEAKTCPQKKKKTSVTLGPRDCNRFITFSTEPTFLFASLQQENMAEVIIESRKPEPYVKCNCKDCITPIEFLSGAGNANKKVKVKCFACHKTGTYELDNTGLYLKNANKSSSSAHKKTSSRKGTG
jgi:hypothetical protein